MFSAEHLSVAGLVFAALFAVLPAAFAAFVTLVPVLRAAPRVLFALDFAALRLRVAAAFFAEAAR